MTTHNITPPCSPSRKRQRLNFSSPVVSEEELTEAQLGELDEIEFKLSQSMSQQGLSDIAKNTTQSNNSPDNPFAGPSNSSSAPTFIGFKTASAISQQNSQDRSKSSPEPSEEQTEEKDYSSWFEPAPSTSFVGFQTATFASASSLSAKKNGSSFLGFETGGGKGILKPSASAQAVEQAEEKDYSSWFEPAPSTSFVGFQTATFASASSLSAKKNGSSFLGFETGGGKGILKPSASAQAEAEKRLKKWQEEDDDAVESPVPLAIEASFRTASSLPSEAPLRSPLRSVENSVIDTPSGFARASNSATFSTAAFQSPLIDSVKRNHVKPFKSPLVNTPNTKTSSPAPFKPPLQNQSQTPSGSSFVSARSQHSFSAAPVNAVFETPVRPKTVASISSISASASRSTPVRKSTPARFVTPFKPGMKPGEPGRKTLETPGGSDSVVKKKVVSLFNLKPPTNRRTLASCGLVPQAYSASDLSSMGIDIDDLSQLTPKNAIFYSFFDQTPPSSSPCFEGPPMFLARDSNLGPKDALNRLLRAGARLATQPWVDNHWTLILWKLAGLVFLDPEQEGTKQPRWSWEEVYRQLLYRYERELSGGVRPPLRRIVNQDTPASCPMILCVSDITWSRRGTEVELRPELEVTDGWYRLRAEIDLPLERAVRRGLIRVGRKLAIVGARLSCERKDGMEILEAYTSVKLGLSGNSTRLAPWHAKLGFQSSFGMVTMRSLTPDGGLVPVMDLVVQKVYPIAYLEIIIDGEGRRIQEGPRSEADEARCVDIWKQTREAEESRLRLEHEKKITRYLGYADRLEHRCGDRFATDEPPDNIESLYDELEEPEDAGRAISRTSLNEAGWLARYIRTRIERDGESARDEIEKELENICPPRNIRSFRVIVVQDARTERFPANRKAQLTIWDVLHVHLTESRSPGHFEVGDRVIVSNLVPSQKSAWMKHKPDSEIFLVSSKNSRWQKVAANA